MVFIWLIRSRHVIDHDRSIWQFLISVMWERSIPRYWPVWLVQRVTKRSKTIVHNLVVIPYTLTVSMMADVQTAFQALVLCGVDHVALFMGETQTQRITGNIFDNSFASCIEVTIKGWMIILNCRNTCCPWRLTVRSVFDLESGRTERRLFRRPMAICKLVLMNQTLCHFRLIRRATSLGVARHMRCSWLIGRHWLLSRSTKSLSRGKIGNQRF